MQKTETISRKINPFFRIENVFECFGVAKLCKKCEKKRHKKKCGVANTIMMMQSIDYPLFI